MKSLSVKAVIKILKRNGFSLLRQKGSHAIYYNPETNTKVLVASHKKNKQLPIGTFLAVVEQSGIPREEFLK